MKHPAEKQNDVLAHGRFGGRRERPRVTVTCPTETMTQQSHKEDCDINVIIKRFEKTGVIPNGQTREALYGDFSSPVDYHESMNVIAKANEQFEALPAAVREKFQNDPQKFLEFAADEKNGDAMLEMGLLSDEATKIVLQRREAAKKELEDALAAHKEKKKTGVKETPEKQTTT